MIVRSERPPARYTNIDNTVIDDPSIDWRDLGLLVFLLSKPNHWEISIEHLSNVRKSGKDAIRVTLKALREAGYIIMKKRGDGNVDYIIYDTKQNQPASEIPSGVADSTENPESENPVQDNDPLIGKNPNRENPIQVNTEGSDQVNTDASRDEESETFIQAKWLASYLARRIKSTNETANPKPEKWIKDIEMLLRIDNQDPRLVKSVIDYLYETKDGSFWQPNILSGRKLRIKFDSLNGYRLRYERTQTDQNNNSRGQQRDPFWAEMQRREQARINADNYSGQ